MRSWSLAALTLLLPLASACGDEVVTDAAEAMTDGGSFLVSFTPNPDPIPLNEAFSLSLMVHDGADTSQLATGVTLAVDATMPEHGHGMNTAPDVTSTGDGAFLAEGFLFHMGGAWELVVDVGLDGSAERATFPIECCEE